MYVSNRIASSSTSDSLAYLATKAAGKAVEDNAEAGSTAHLAGGVNQAAGPVGISCHGPFQPGSAISRWRQASIAGNIAQRSKPTSSS